jgi:predicted phage terminase large subunit-like protein
MALAAGKASPVTERTAELPLGVVIRKQPGVTRWAKWVWRPVGVLPGAPDADWRELRREGEALDPNRYPLERLAQFRNDAGTWAALYQQNPVAGDAALFTEGLMALTECRMADIPSRLMYYTTWDTALGQTTQHDYSVGMTGGVDVDGLLWIVDVQRGRWDTYDLIDRIIEGWRVYRQDLVGIEKTAQAVAIGPVLELAIDERRAHGLTLVDLEHGNKDKVARARPIQARVRSGKVRIPVDAPWYQELRKELLEFPAGRYKDQVDAFAWLGHLLDEVVTPRETVPIREQGWRDRLAGAPSGRRRSWRTA